MDPSGFRDTMKLLKYDGEEPLWAKMDFMDKHGVGGV
jgi:hypothetical protein